MHDRSPLPPRKLRISGDELGSARETGSLSGGNERHRRLKGADLGEVSIRPAGGPIHHA
jgi:hypothetical protein